MRGQKWINPRQFTCAVLMTLAFAMPCLAQQEYKLAEDDTWKATGEVDPATPEGRLAQVRRRLADGDAERAHTLASQWIDEHATHPLLPEAYLLRGDALVALDDEYEALFDYEFIARSHPGSEVFITAISRELDIAKRYADGYKRKLFGMRITGAESEAEKIFILTQERLPGSRLAEEAGMELADYYFERRQMELAATAYDLFIENYPDSDQLDKARRRLVYSHLAQFKGPEFDAAGLYEARAKLQQLRAIRPTDAERMGADAILVDIKETDAEKMLTTARWYQRVGDAVAAEMMIRRLITRYPRSASAAQALREIREILASLPEDVLKDAPDYDALRNGLIEVSK